MKNVCRYGRSMVAGILSTLLLLSGSFLAIPVQAEEVAEDIYAPPAIAAEAAYIINEETGTVLYEKNAETQMSAASLVKMMTALVVMDHVKDIDAESVTARTWTFDIIFDKNPSTADIWNGETRTVRELLYAMLLPSGNEAALMLAGYVGGGADYNGSQPLMDNFLHMMNNKAGELGCTNTSFVDADGLGEENLTTARDMYLITRAFMANPLLAEIAGTPEYIMSAQNHSADYSIWNTNRFTQSNDIYAQWFSPIASSVLGGKTGSLGDWQSFASKAVLGGENYICVVLHSPNEADAIYAAGDSSQYRPALYETGVLYYWAYSKWSSRSVLDTTKPITEVKVKYSTQSDNVKLIPAQDIKTTLPNDAPDSDITMTFDLPAYLAAPVKQGDIAGTMTVSVHGREVGTVDLIIEKSVSRNPVLFVMQKLGEFSKSAVFKVLLVLVVLLVVVYVAYTMQSNKKRVAEREKIQKTTPQSRQAKGGKSQPANRNIYRVTNDNKSSKKR